VRSGAPRGARLGIGLAIATLALDQATKFYIFRVLDLPERGTIEVLPILDLSFVWNHGISLGLFQQGSEIGRWALVSLELAAVIFILLWMWRTKSLVTTVALGLIAGGAAGNAIDRALFGAVLDFLHLHAGNVRWLDFPYIFNVADSGISLGVALLVLESLFVRTEPKGEALEPGRDSR
jgi:signal peptidase II